MRPQQGISLIELMVVLAVMAILSGIAFPALGSMVAVNDLNTSQENLIATLKKARGMAVSHSTLSTVSINAAAHTVQLSVADNSFPAETIQLRPSVKIAADATLTFGAQGTVTATAGSSAIALSALNFTNLPTRNINISSTGIVSASRY